MKNKILKKVLLGVVLAGLTNMSYAGYCKRGSTVVGGGTLSYLIGDALDIGIGSSYMGTPAEKTVTDIMKLTIKNLGTGRVTRPSCLQVSFRYKGATYSSGRIRRIGTNRKSLQPLGKCLSEGERNGFRILKENILPHPHIPGGKGAGGDTEVFYLFDAKKKLSYPFWIGGHDIFKYDNEITRKTNLMSSTAATKCELALEEAIAHRNNLLHNEILREAPANYPSPRRRPRSFQGRPPVGVPPMLPPVLAY